MPYKDPEKQKEYNLEYQRVWIIKKLKERKAKGICAVSGCGKDAEGKKYCTTHNAMHNAEEKKRRAKKKLEKV
jgi:hypothetical protein